jgi:hypothetical protein
MKFFLKFHHRLLNSRLLARPGSVFTLLQKETPGHPQGFPVDPALQALQVPVAVGAFLPAMQFLNGQNGTTRLNKMTHAQLNDIEWFYNETFGGLLFLTFLFYIYQLFISLCVSVYYNRSSFLRVIQIKALM